MAEPVEAKQADEATPSAGARAAAAVSGVGAGTADLTEDLARAGGAALAGTLRVLTRTWGDIVGVTIDAFVAAVLLSTRRRRPQSRALGGRGSGARACLDLIDLRTPEQIDEALAKGLAAAAPPAARRAAE